VPSPDATLTAAEIATIAKLVGKFEPEAGGGLSVGQMEYIWALGAYLLFASGRHWSSTEEDHEERISLEELQQVATTYKQKNGEEHLAFFLERVATELAQRVAHLDLATASLLSGDEEVAAEECFEALDTQGTRRLVLAEVAAQLGAPMGKELGEVALQTEGEVSREEWIQALANLKQKRGDAILSYYLEWLRGTVQGFRGQVPHTLPSGVIGVYEQLTKLTGSPDLVREDIVAAQGGDLKTFEKMDQNHDDKVTQEEFCLFYLAKVVEKSEKYVAKLVAQLTQGVVVLVEAQAAKVLEDKALDEAAQATVEKLDGDARALYALLDYNKTGGFTKDCYVAAAGGDFGAFEQMGPDENSFVTVDKFSEWLIALLAEKGETRAKLVVENLTQGAQAKWAEFAKAKEDLQARCQLPLRPQTRIPTLPVT
jgi:hypothetical protein